MAKRQENNDEMCLLSVVAWIGVEMEFPLSPSRSSGDTFEHRPSECGHCVQDFLADLNLRDLPGEAAGFELGTDDTLPTADLRFYPAALVVPCGRLPGHAAIAADLGNMAIPNRRIRGRAQLNQSSCSWPRWAPAVIPTPKRHRARNSPTGSAYIFAWWSSSADRAGSGFPINSRVPLPCPAATKQE